MIADSDPSAFSTHSPESSSLARSSTMYSFAVQAVTWSLTQEVAPVVLIDEAGGVDSRPGGQCTHLVLLGRIQ